MLITNVSMAQFYVNKLAETDSFIWEFKAEINYGDNMNLYVGGDTILGGNNMLIKWNLSDLPTCIEIISAEIQIYQHSAMDDTAFCSIQRITEAWDEYTITWNNQPNTTGFYGNFYFTSYFGWRIIPATELINDWIKYGNEGVMFINLPESTVDHRFSSKEGGNGPRLIIMYDYGNNSNPATTVTATPNPVEVGETTLLSLEGGELGSGAEWKWYKNSCGEGEPIGVGSSVIVMPTEETEYFVRAEGFCDTTECANVFVDLLYVNVDENYSSKSVSAYPNPVKNYLTLKFEEPLNGYIEVYNILGERVFHKNVSQTINNIDLSNILKGIYFIQIFDENEILLFTKKVLKD